MYLSDEEKEEVIKLIRSDRFLPPRYRSSLFEDVPESELIWPGKTLQIEKSALPFQSIEHIDEPRSGTVVNASLFSIDDVSGRQKSGWTNKLIWGDNKLILSSLRNGSSYKQILDAGGIKLVYIDPPFDVGADFSIDVEVGGEDLNKEASIIEQIAYRDTWGKGKDSYANMIAERLRLISNLMAPSGTIFFHCDYRTSGINRLILDEVFGPENFLNEIVWLYGLGGSSKRYFPRKHDTIFWYSKSNDYFFDPPMIPASSQAMKGQDKKAPDYWDIPNINNMAEERLSYPTQKPEALLERIISAASEPGDLVMDFFCGSGTTLAVAEKLGRKWIGVDLGRFAIHTSRKRLIETQRSLATEDRPYRAFEILNLGSYERQFFSDNKDSLSEEQKLASEAQRRDQFLNLVLEVYGAQKTTQIKGFHGVKDNTLIYVGNLDSPVTENEVRKSISEALEQGITRIDILGFEFEMGIKPVLADEARESGLLLSMKYIPNDIFDSRSLSDGDVSFFDVGYLEVAARIEDLSLTIELKDFSVFHAHDDAHVVGNGLKKGSSKIIVDGGQAIKITKNKNGKLATKNLTELWTDWIDYWSIDFDFQSQKEILTTEANGEYREVWTGRYIFENEWQDFRTRKKRTLKTESAPYRYSKSGSYKVAVKVIDIFGNDTTKVVEVEI